MSRHNAPTRLPRSAVAAMLLLACVWGANMAAIKIGSQMVSPIFSAFLRSLIATACLAAWMRARSIPFFPDRVATGHGLVAGLLFGTEFVLIYLGLSYTLASRGYVLLYTHPFFVALGAHFWLHADRLSPAKVGGLLLAFAGVMVLFVKDWGGVTYQTLPGDLLLLAAGALWGASTLYIKKYMPGRSVPTQTLLYQLLFSVPLLLAASLVMEDKVWLGYSWQGAAALAYQSFIVAFASYLLWFELLHRHTASLLTAFTFFTPVLGVLISGVLILGEPFTSTMGISLGLVIAGMCLINPPRLRAQGVAQEERG